MKMQLPANFIGSGAFAIAAMVGVAVFAEREIHRPGATYAVTGHP
jgi:hypothetical protein